MMAYYNEHDAYAAQWLRNLIAAGVIAPGIVDERSIEDVLPSELEGYTQCHFFAGLGGWSYALRRAGWPDDRQVWTASCPCQPYSAAGQGGGFADERHLWPAFYHLLEQCTPPDVYGEQVASKGALPWLDLVQTDMEASGYAFGAVDLCAAGVGAPHIRQRLWFIARRPGDAFDTGLERLAGPGDGGDQSRRQQAEQVRSTTTPGSDGGLADLHCDRLDKGWGRIATSGDDGIIRDSSVSRVDDATGSIKGRVRDGSNSGKRNAPAALRGNAKSQCTSASDRPGPTNGFWRDVDWLGCRDGKWRPVRPGSFPLVNGAPSRVGRLRAYGNSICIKAAEAFIASTIDSTDNKTNNHRPSGDRT